MVLTLEERQQRIERERQTRKKYVLENPDRVAKWRNYQKEKRFLNRKNIPTFLFTDAEYRRIRSLHIGKIHTRLCRNCSRLYLTKLRCLFCQK